MTLALIPAFSPGEKEKRSQRFGANLWLDWCKRFGKSENVPGDVLSPGRVALMGIAQRRVAVKYGQKSRGLKHINALETNAKTLGDWIKAKREAKNLTPSHLAARMGIAAALVYSWEDNTHLPSSQQLVNLFLLLAFNADEVSRLLIHDRSTLFSESFRHVLHSAGVQTKQSRRTPGATGSAGEDGVILHGSGRV